MVDVLGLKPEDYWTLERAKEYDSKRNIEKIQREITLKAVELLGLEKGLILDAGCGTGFSSLALKDSGFSVVGVDVSEGMCSVARSKGVEVFRASFEKLPFSNNHFDGIICVSSLQWFSGSYDDVLESYTSVSNEFFRVLKKGCKCVIQFYPSSLGEFNLVKQVFSRKFLVEEFKAFNGRKSKIFLVLTRKGLR